MTIKKKNQNFIKIKLTIILIGVTIVLCYILYGNTIKGVKYFYEKIS